MDYDYLEEIKIDRLPGSRPTTSNKFASTGRKRIVPSEKITPASVRKRRLKIEGLREKGWKEESDNKLSTRNIALLKEHVAEEDKDVPKRVSEEEIAGIISRWTGIPVSKLTSIIKSAQSTISMETPANSSNKIPY